MLLSRSDLKVSAGPIARGSAVGTGLGILPGAGSTVASFVSYGIEKKVARRPEEFGRGAIQGVAGPESANNAAANTSFIPMLSLGVPGSATTAVLLGALILHGIQPGPLLIENEPALFWGVLASFFLGNALLLIQNLPLAPAFASILTVPYRMLYPLILVLCLVGAFAVENSMFGIWVVLAFGVVGYLANRYGYPPVALLLGLILGPLLEDGLTRSSAIGDGSLAVLFERPISLILMVLTVAVLCFYCASSIRNLRKRQLSIADAR